MSKTVFTPKSPEGDFNKVVRTPIPVEKNEPIFSTKRYIPTECSTTNRNVNSIRYK